MSLIKLKIKHLSLAQEQRLIRRQENALRKWKKYLNKQHEEAESRKGIRKFLYVENRQYNPTERADLREHRLEVLRPRVRAAHLARGYLKGMPYRVMERLAYDSPDWGRVWDNVVRFGKVEDTEANMKKLMEWADVPGEQVMYNKHNHRRDYSAYQPVSNFIKSALV